ncbi:MULTISPECIES: hypothetical protein [unclassified Streptomyces]|uniref:hypothetical protein n=1 Tax=unclassified Streptomyces TaxID=2593676 RepID=UPI002DD9AFA2|nr:hypothetical protein [Streptomyces sp. NBC_01445]WSE10157.1 hypothetical protein OG574_46730 [Streptomyces sp. NBC_01445]
MAVSLSLTLLLAVVVVLLLRFGSVRIGGATVCALFGFALASTGIAPAINSGLSAVAGLISSL